MRAVQRFNFEAGHGELTFVSTVLRTLCGVLLSDRGRSRRPERVPPQSIRTPPWYSLLPRYRECAISILLSTYSTEVGLALGKTLAPCVLFVGSISELIRDTVELATR